MRPGKIERVLVTGATGFVGQHLLPELYRAGLHPVCVSRNPERARQDFPGREFRFMDVLQAESIAPAMRDCQAAVYLVHSMATGGDYETLERQGAESFREAAEEVGLSRIVYLGGVPPSGEPSPHLRSRLATGEILRSGSVSTLELRAAMIVGHGSESWRIVRDLASRLPFMLLPRWLDSLSEPIGIDDVVLAITRALTLPVYGSHAYALPGPERLSAREIIRRAAAILGHNPRMYRVPFVSPRLSSYWIRLVTSANRHIAEALVEGLRSDLLAEGESFWEHFADEPRTSFDEAARRAFARERGDYSKAVRSAERVLRSAGRKTTANHPGP
jgi:uncharacterized protein YbjT (DUF2867 family)